MKNKRQRFSEFFHREKHRAAVSLLAAAAVTGVYMAGNIYPPGLLSYIVATPALVGVIFTALARVNDIGPERTSWSWQLRRLGLTMTGATAVAYLYAPFGSASLYPTWLAVIGWWGFFVTWLTTPGMPPWHKYIFGDVQMNRVRTTGD